ncbi:carbohydrate kinase family protein [Jannaschia sp. W003]|uniref:carbohydrate kinase family protein n=1 Tax=Jannaschia sp. W003 TaxID=2867012 RepID=UPI0021A3809C|nr:carbohydrate kinase family protein [Jannaschia sp. W003]UWQ21787.1 carbohydrate kinase family protein [Jannaschia sp. W003]
MIDLVTVGWLTVDDIVLENGTCRKAMPGGGALYSAIGAAIWNPNVGVHAPAGRPHAERSRAGIAGWGLDVAGIATAEGNGLELWMLHESDAHKQQIMKLGSSTPLDMDAARGAMPEAYTEASGIHVAPQGPESSIRTVEALRRPGRKLTMDILADGMIDASRYADLSYLDSLDAFLPSEAEIARIWGPARIEDWLAATARRAGAHVVGKIGAEGSLLAEAGRGRIVHVPALEVDLADATGAGDAYCGGFLAGLATGRPLVECGAMGTVSASYVVEAYGALATQRPDPEARNARYARALAGAAPI